MARKNHRKAWLCDVTRGQGNERKNSTFFSVCSIEKVLDFAPSVYEYSDSTGDENRLHAV